MAAEYEVNIKLNTGKAEAQLKSIESSVAKIGKTEKQSVNTTDQRTAAMVKLRNVGDQVRKLEEQGAKLGKLRFQLDKAAAAINKGNLLTAKQRISIVESELRTQKNITTQLERQAAAQRRARTKKATDVATGAGFPLLFGGGPLQAVAGGLGGLVGGLGGAIALSATVAQLEAFGKETAKTGQALNSTGGALDLMREKSLFSTEEIEKHASVLEEQGKVAELSALLTSELVDKIGNNGVEALQSLGKETDETTRLWNELTLQLQALIAGPLQGFLEIVNNFLGGVANRGRLAALEKDLEGTIAGRRLKSEIGALTPETTFTQQGEAKTVKGALRKW